MTLIIIIIFIIIIIIIDNNNNNNNNNNIMIITIKYPDLSREMKKKNKKKRGIWKWRLYQL